jgi:2-polyprenyl-3-methyl-5-hydroxy-6-metoxy-1,4-benzoquinol methylase
MTIEARDITREDLSATNDFVKQYIAARAKEERIYSNEEVALLPDVPSSHKYYKEWQIRKASAKRLINYLKQKNKALEILEVGCGNGWLSAAMSKINGSVVTGIDINEPEIQQAKETFKAIPNVNYRAHDVESHLLKKKSFDIIVFAASLQYFSSLFDVLKQALSLLSKDGEVHIIDTHFYQAVEIEAARKRTEEYYTLLGFPGLSNNYFHHSLVDLEPFNYKVLFNPFALVNRLIAQKHPFYWIRIK